MRSASSCFVGAHDDVGKGGKRRIAQPFAKFDFLLVEAFVVLFGGKTDGVVIGIQSLNHHAAGRIAAAGAPGSLGEELKRAFGGAEIGNAESDIGKHDTDKRDIGNVVAFGDHLRADKNVELRCHEIR